VAATEMNQVSTNKRWIKGFLQILVLTLVVWGISDSLRKSAAQLASQRDILQQQATQLRAEAREIEDAADAVLLLQAASELEKSAAEFWQAQPVGLVLAGLIYAAGMLPGSLFWRQCLAALHQPTHLLTTLWAYFYGNLGKYFPGKAMVIILRLAALERLGIKKTAVSITIFMETLTMMSVGGAIAAICLILLNIDWRLTLLSVGLLIATFLPTFPPLLRFLLPKLQRGVDPLVLHQWASRIHVGLFARGWLQLSVTWFAFGVSLLLVLRSLKVADYDETNAWILILSSLGACALAVVLGFVSLIPGGAGVREVVLSLVLTPVVGPVAALCGSIWLRIVWLATELIIVGLLFVVKTLIPLPMGIPSAVPMPMKSPHSSQ
jgi:glycosyltransferase 2 family protein